MTASHDEAIVPSPERLAEALVHKYKVRTSRRATYAMALAPVLTAMMVVATIGVCYSLWAQGESAKRTPGVYFPAISALGVGFPEKRVYQIGFAFTGFLLGGCVLIFHNVVAPVVLVFHPTAKERLASATQMGYYCAVGVAVQG